MKTTVEIAGPLLREAKQEAEKMGVTLRDLIELGLRRELDARKKQTKPFKLRDASFKGTGVQPGVREDDGRAMRAYSYIGTPGMPDSIEGINEMLDAMDRDEKGDK
jgi:hypothetical protein